jgi:hypothetical protein
MSSTGPSKTAPDRPVIAFDGTLSPADGVLRPDWGRSGLGLEVKWPDLEQYRIYGRSRE